jgi:amino acid transporter
MSDQKKKEIGLGEAVAIGIGGMVGGGIFAVLGLAVQLSGGGTYIAFSIAGIVALMTAFSYAHLSVKFPSEGGTVTYIVEAFGKGLFAGSMNILLWISYIVMLSLYAYAFGSYGATFFPQSEQLVWKHVLITAVILGMTLLNILRARVVGRAEGLIVGIKLAILALFVAVGMFSVNTAYLLPDTWSPPLTLVAGGFIIFVAYEGFELIGNTAGDIKDPSKNLPRAFYISVVTVILLYVAIAIVTVGNLPLDQIVAAKDYALAAAASPFLGQIGFVLIVVAALLSTASAINATLYGTARFSYLIARYGELPKTLEKKIWDRPLEGLFITAGVTLVIANLLDLRSISTMGSAGFLLIFAAVNWANVKLCSCTGIRKAVSIAAMVVCLGAVVALVAETAINAPGTLWVLALMIGLSVGIEALYRRYRKTLLNPPGFQKGEKA